MPRGGRAPDLAGRSVLIATRTQRESATALVELDGLVRRLVVAPPDLNPDHLAAIAEDAEIEAIVSDDPLRFEALGLPRVSVASEIASAAPMAREHDTQWVLLTSGTLGRPKMVAHTLDALTGAIKGAPHDGPVTWSTFYDIRRYGGLQMLLRALLGNTDFVLTDAAEPLGGLLHRLGDAGVTAISGTPSHWRRVLMSRERGSVRAALHPPLRRDRRPDRARRAARRPSPRPGSSTPMPRPRPASASPSPTAARAFPPRCSTGRARSR